MVESVRPSEIRHPAVVVLEGRKMENSITAARAGTVAEIKSSPARPIAGGTTSSSSSSRPAQQSTAAFRASQASAIRSAPSVAIGRPAAPVPQG